MLALTFCLLLHPFHSTISEVEWNAQTQRLEVSLRMQSIDVQRAVGSETASAVAIDSISQEKLVEIMQKYIGKRFRLEADASPATDDSVGKLKWVGIEEQGASFWFYFELIPPEQPRPWRLRNSLLQEFESDQVNTVRFRGDRPTSLNFTRQNPVQAIPSVIP